MFNILPVFIPPPVLIYFQKSRWKADAWLVPNWDLLTNLLESSNKLPGKFISEFSRCLVHMDRHNKLNRCSRELQTHPRMNINMYSDSLVILKSILYFLLLQKLYMF